MSSNKTLGNNFHYTILTPREQEFSVRLEPNLGILENEPDEEWFIQTGN